MITNSIPIPLTYLPNKSWLEREEYKMGAEKEKYLFSGKKEKQDSVLIQTSPTWTYLVLGGHKSRNKRRSF